MDFSEYTGPSEEWIAVARELPPAPALSTEELKAVTNKGREDVSARDVVEHGILFGS